MSNPPSDDLIELVRDLDPGQMVFAHIGLDGPNSETWETTFLIREDTNRVRLLGSNLPIEARGALIEHGNAWFLLTMLFIGRDIYHCWWNYCTKVLDRLPVQKEDGKNQISSQCKQVFIDTEIPAHSVIAILSSSLFFWFYQTFSDCQQINQREFTNFKFTFAPKVLEKLEVLGKELNPLSMRATVF
jgi:hypothetical protein